MKHRETLVNEYCLNYPNERMLYHLYIQSIVILIWNAISSLLRKFQPNVCLGMGFRRTVLGYACLSQEATWRQPSDIWDRWLVLQWSCCVDAPSGMQPTNRKFQSSVCSPCMQTDSWQTSRCTASSLTRPESLRFFETVPIWRAKKAYCRVEDVESERPSTVSEFVWILQRNALGMSPCGYMETIVFG
jgi:hypothetical protein